MSNVPEKNKNKDYELRAIAGELDEQVKVINGKGVVIKGDKVQEIKENPELEKEDKEIEE